MEMEMGLCCVCVYFVVTVFCAFFLPSWGFLEGDIVQPPITFTICIHQPPPLHFTFPSQDI